MDTLSQTQLVDMLLEAYLDWREACARANEAYHAGASQPGPCGRAAFEIYMAALDAEDEAAAGYATVVRQANRRLWSEQLTAGSREPTWGASST